MQIGELARRSSVTVQTVRFYERLKLLPEPQRKDSGYRVYSETDLKRLRFVRQGKSLGFSLDEIRDILRMRERGHCPCGEVFSIAERHLQSVEQQSFSPDTFKLLESVGARWTEMTPLPEWNAPAALDRLLQYLCSQGRWQLLRGIAPLLRGVSELAGIAEINRIVWSTQTTAEWWP